MDDANFAIDTANAAILALFVEEAWVQEMLQAKYVMRWGRSVYSSCAPGQVRKAGVH